MRTGMIKAAVGRVSAARIPWHLLAVALALVGVGAAFIYSADSARMAVRHLVFAAVGCGVFLGLTLFDYRHMRAFALPLYALCLAALAGLFVLGTELNFARRWYNLGLVHVQPSEPMKYVLAVVLADYFRTPRPLERLRQLVVPALLTGLPTLLILLQPDLGSALILVPVFFVMAFVAGVPVRNLLLVAALGVALLLIAWVTPGALKDYQKQRVLGFVNPARNPDSHAAYNAEQAVMAIQAGGLHGQGYGRGVLNRLRRIPESYADFMFPVIAEEWGFVRTVPLAGVYLLMVLLMGRVAWRTREPFGRLIVVGVLTLFGFQSALHMAISLRLAPITGLPMPLVGYGGSAMVSTFAGLGLVASVCAHRSVIFHAEEQEPPR